SKALDRLLVRGQDQLYSIKKVLVSHRRAVISGAGGFIDSHSPAAGEYWRLFNVTAWDEDNATTAHLYIEKSGALEAYFNIDIRAIPAYIRTQWHGNLLLAEGDVIRVLFTGALAADNCNIDITGHVMTLET
ncbi:unnamed protein product, partial [marine sediment metagenome]